MIKDPPLTQISITEALGVRGWAHLDAVLLAALATEAPLLLVGPHGTAKSLLVERMSAALGLDMRHYNAALINYDDLVGIPLPDESGSQLKFITTPGTIWDAGFVFFDEISRCRSDLQNKLFPIIHERRVVGIKLETLRHRWAAMNPPAPDDLSGEANPQEYYLGSEPLDPALTDRFPFVINVPNWGELSKHDRLDLVAWQNAEPDLSEFNLPGLVARCRQWIPALETDFEEWLGDYIVYMVDLLEQNKLPQSPRRARMLARSVVAVHAARLVLEGEHADPEESAETALIYGLPQNATEVPPSQVQVVAVHKQAWEMNQYLEDDRWRQVMEEYDMARRVALADQLEFTDEEMSRLITQTLGAEDSDARQVGLATAMFLAFRERRDLDPSAYEPLAQLAYHVLEPRLLFPSVAANSGDARTWREITEWITEYKGREDSAMYRLYRNFVLNGFPNMWRDVNWKEALTAFAQDLTLFGIEEVKE